jgi:hypothetical protein
VTGIDMTAAFDTIIRQELLDITNDFLNEDENRLIRILLSNTKLTIKMNNVEAQQFKSNVVSLQGDGLSSTLFNIYSEAALCKLRLKLDRNDIVDEHSYVQRPVSQIMPEEAIYADDYDQITTSVERHTKFVNKSKEILEVDNLKVNESKTKLTILKRDTEENEQWRETKKLGSLLVDNEDVTNRKHLAIAVIFNFGMTLNIEKCLIGKTEIPWWGIIISSEGIKPDQREKVRAL